MKTFSAIVLAAAFAGATAISSAALAMSPGGAGGGSSSPKCAKGKIYDKNRMMCVNPKTSSVDDGSLADYAIQLAKAGEYRDALQTLDMLKQPNTAEALNYRGYATRKLGRVDEGIGYYHKALALDPEYTLVREYLGEAYVSQGKLELARQELSEIKKRCGTTCEEYRDLSEAIDAALVKG
jgi:predicted Zn-dependent protease